MQCSHHEGCTKIANGWRGYINNSGELEDEFGFCIQHSPYCSICDLKATRDNLITYDIDEDYLAGNRYPFCDKHGDKNGASAHYERDGQLWLCDHCGDCIYAVKESDISIYSGSSNALDNHICSFNDPIKEPDSCYN